MKLKYNHNGETESIPLSKKKPEGKRLAVHHDDSNFYAPLVDAGDATASKLKTVYMGEVYAVRQMPAPEIENILIAPPRVSVMQGQSATATVSAEGNEAVAGLSFSIANNPTWITIAAECILIQPSDNDLGEAIVEVRAKDIGSNASMSTAFVAEALLRPIITQLGIAPPAVTVGQGQSATALIEAVANSAVGGLSYSLDGAPSWIRNDNDTIYVEPTTNDIGTANVQVVAYDPNSSARTDTSFTAEAVMVPAIYGVIASPSTVEAMATYTDTVTLSADYNELVTGIEYSLTGAPSWMTISGNKITCSPTANDVGTVTVTVTAHDTGSDATASTELVVNAQAYGAKITNVSVMPSPALKNSRVVGWQGNTLNYPLTCTANSAVTSVRYSLAPSDDNPPWLRVYNYVSLRAAPSTTNSALGDTATVTLVAYDTGSTAQATTAVNVSVIEKPVIGAITLSDSIVAAAPGNPVTITVCAPKANSGVMGIEASLNTNHPSWVSAVDDKIIVAPQTGAESDASITVCAVDTGSTVQSATVRAFVRACEILPAISNVSVCPSSLLTHSSIVAWQDSTLLYPLTCTTNSAVTSVRYSLAPSENNPAWMSVTLPTGKASLKVAPTSVNSALGDTATVTIVAQDTKSQAQATTKVAVPVKPSHSIGAVTFSETDVTGYPEKAATITITPNIGAGVTDWYYSLSATPSWITLSGNNIFVRPARGTTDSTTVSIRVVDRNNSELVNLAPVKSFGVRASVMPEITEIQTNTINFRNRERTIAPIPVKKTSEATYGMRYTVEADRDWFSHSMPSANITLCVPDSEPISSVPATGNISVTVANPIGNTMTGVIPYSIDMRETVSCYCYGTLTTKDDGVIKTTYEKTATWLNCWPHTLLVDVTAGKSIPSGYLSLVGSHVNTSPPITLTAESDRKTFHIKWVRGNNDSSSYIHEYYPAVIKVDHPTIHTPSEEIGLYLTKLPNDSPVAFTKKI